MSRDHDELSQRPDRVIIVDADDPMTEVRGRFVWQEEHDRVVEEVRRRAFADGYAAGQSDQSPQPMSVTLRRRRSIGWYARLAVLGLLVLLVALMAPIVLF